MTTKVWTDDKMFQFRNDLLSTGLGGGKNILGKRIIVCKKEALQTMHRRNDRLFPVDQKPFPFSALTRVLEQSTQYDWLQCMILI